MPDLSAGPGRGHRRGPVVGDVLVVWIVRPFQFLGADVAQHDTECEEAEHADHQKDVHHALRLSRSPGSGRMVHSLLGSVVLRCLWRQYACAVEAVLQEEEQEGLQLGSIDV